VQLEALDSFPKQVLRVLLALKRLEEQKLHATYSGLQHLLGVSSRSSAYQALLRARRAGLVVTIESTAGGQGRKATFGLTDKGREALR